MTTVDTSTMAARVANAPVFSLYDTSLGHGEIGGMLSVIESDARSMAEAVIARLRGNARPSEPLTRLPAVPVSYFDWQVIERFGGDADRLPSETRFINRPIPIWNQYRQWVIGGAALMALMTGLIVALVWQNRRRKVAEKLSSRNAARLNAIIEASPVPLCVNDEDGNIIMLNNAFEERLGYTRGDIPNLEAWRSRAYPDEEYRRTKFEEWKICREQTRRNKQSVTRMDWDITCKDGLVRNFTLSSADLDKTFSGLRLIAFEDNTERNQSMAAIRESELRYRSMIELLPEGINIYQFGKFAYLNLAAIRMMGATSEDVLLGKSFLEFVHPDSLPYMKDRYIRLTKLGENIPWQELKVIKVDGSIIDIEAQAASIVFEGASAIQVIWRDITQRKLGLAKLEQSEHRYRSLIEHSGEGIAVHRHGEIVYVNPALIKMFGASSAQELMGTKLTDLVHPEERPIVLSRIDAMVERGEQTPVLEVRHDKLDGTPIDVEVFSERIVFDGLPSINTIMRDITFRKQADQRYRDLIEHLPLATMVHRDQLILFVNQACITMLGASSAQELIGKSVYEFVHPDDHASMRTRAERIRGGTIAAAEEVRIVRLGGAVIWCEAETKSFVFEGAPAIYSVLRDTTALRQADAERAALAEQLRESQKMEAIGTLAGGIAHDFNNAIAAILGNVELAQLDAVGNEKALESLGEIKIASTRARELVQQILAFSRRQVAVMEPTSLAAIVEECGRLLRATLPARISLDIQCEPDLPNVLANAGQIHQVLINLGTNAMHAIGRVSGRISMRVERANPEGGAMVNSLELRKLYAEHLGGLLRIVVTDTGAGMDSETLKRIFEPFFTTKRVGEGTGLGLSVVHGIVRSHRGEITVQSEPGKGTTFTVYLPTAMAAQTQATPEREGKAVTATPDFALEDAQHILYLDDDGVLVGLVRRLLERRGWRVSAYVDQEQALAALRADPDDFDLVVSDYNMPGLSGLDVAREVRNIRSDLPVVVASGFVDEELQANAREAGVREVIFKAEAMEKFCDVVAGVLAEARNSTKGA